VNPGIAVAGLTKGRNSGARRGQGSAVPHGQEGAAPAHGEQPGCDQRRRKQEGPGPAAHPSRETHASVIRKRMLRGRNAVMVLQHPIVHPGPVRVLVVEDHAKLAITLATGLRRAGMAVDVVFNGQDALERLAVTAYDVVVLDRDIPGVHGDDVCRALVAEGSSSRVLMLTAAGSVENRVGGLDIGADDYLPKPCDFTELVARIRALARRPGASLPPTLAHGGLRLDPSRRIAARDGRRLPLNPKEFAVLELLLTAPGVVMPAEEILERVWDEAADPFSQAVRTTISRLRAKLGDPPLIETVAKAGYRIAG